VDFRRTGQEHEDITALAQRIADHASREGGIDTRSVVPAHGRRPIARLDVELAAMRRHNRRVADEVRNRGPVERR
jgi:hypothetical protein